MIGVKLILTGMLLSCLCLTAALVGITGSSVFAPGWQPVGNQTGRAGEAALEPATTACEISEGFPEAVRRWCDPIQRAAHRHNLAPGLIAALIWLESGGSPQAYSSSGAVGLMQVMPRDGKAAAFRCANGPCFHDRPTIEELNDPEFNIAYGARMLAELLARSGDLREALKAYGPMDAGYTYADRVLGIYGRVSASTSQ